MLLRNQDRYLDLLHINVVRDVRERREAVDKNIACDGFFFEHDDNLFALGAEAGEIYLILNGQLLKHDANTQWPQIRRGPFESIRHSAPPSWPAG